MLTRLKKSINQNLNLIKLNPFNIAPTVSIQQVEREQPIRSELYSAYQMAIHGAHLAKTHVVVEQIAPDKLLARLDDNERVIIETCALLTKALKDKRQITPASEWLLDNLPLIEEQISLARKHLPKGYSRGLPRLLVNGQEGNPRAYELALEIISHGDARLESESLNLFIGSYQKITPLKLGELWAIPIMLRLALLENLRRVAAQIAISRVDRNLADLWSDKMIKTIEESPSDLVLVIADMARSQPNLSTSFIAEMARQLQGRGSELAMPLAWLEQRLEQIGMTTEQMVYVEIQQQAVEQVSVSNSVGSLRFLKDVDWQEFVEESSVVEQILRQDPTDVYAQMDFITRDRYRHKVENLAKQAGKGETEIAQKVIELAQANASDPRLGHVGYYLIDKGQFQTEQGLTLQLQLHERLVRWVQHYPLSVYLGAIIIITVDIGVTLTNHARKNDLEGGLLVLLGFFCVLAASHFSIAMVNWFATITAKPAPLARLDFSKGIPDSARSLITVPTMLTSTASIDRISELLEVRFLANKEDNLYYCLLTDFLDSDTEKTSEDEVFLAYAQKTIEELNERYSKSDHDIFFLFHRPRLWNPAQGKWMGEERKRGKLGALNEFLLEGKTAPFSLIVGNTRSLQNIRYVITLDSDTQLPRSTASQFAAAMAHPLNRPVYDEDRQRVVAGYGILQPRVAASLPGDDSSLYADLSGGEPGIDPYTRAVSDVYQDAFGEGSFIGKGIYDVAIFEKVLKNRFLDNRILSHDLLEGCFVRSGLLSDVQLYEAYPSKYSDDVSRRHRWIRGDWQIAGWIFGAVSRKGKERVRNPLSVLSRWKIADNLRRSLVPVSFLGIITYAFLLSPTPGFWLWQIAFLLLVPSLYASLFDLSHKSKDISLNQHLMESAYAAVRHFSNTLFSFICLPYEAYYTMDAILRTLWRTLVSKRNLLEWTASSEATYKIGTDLGSVIRRMWIAPVFSAIVAFIMIQHNMPALSYALSILGFWFLSPLVVWHLSLPKRSKVVSLNDHQVIYLGKLARKTWAFFEMFVGEGDNWLPPTTFRKSLLPWLHIVPRLQIWVFLFWPTCLLMTLVIYR